MATKKVVKTKSKPAAPVKKVAVAAKKPVAKPVAKKAAAPVKKTTAKKVAPVAKKPVRKAAAAESAIKPCKKRFTATELIKVFAEAGGVEPKQVKAIMAKQQDYIIACLKHGGIGSAKLLGWNFKSTYKPAQKGGQKKPNPFKPGEMMVTKSRPATMRAKALSMKAVKDGIAI